MDPHSRIAREAVRRAAVVGLTATGVGVRWGGDSKVEEVSPRQVLSLWDGWEEALAARDAAANSQSDAISRRREVESAALADALDRYPTARLVDHCIVIPAEDWVAR